MDSKENKGGLTDKAKTTNLGMETDPEKKYEEEESKSVATTTFNPLKVTIPGRKNLNSCYIHRHRTYS